MNRLVDVCLERAIEGTEDVVFDHGGRVIGHRTRHSDRMAMFLLRAHMPELFRDAHRADRARGESLPPPPEPVVEAVRAIDPVAPAEPHRLMAPDDLADAIQVADILDGQLPRWHRDPDLDDDPEPPAGDATPPEPYGPLGESFERALEAAKAGVSPPDASPRRPLPPHPAPQHPSPRPHRGRRREGV